MCNPHNITRLLRPVDPGVKKRRRQNQCQSSSWYLKKICWRSQRCQNWCQFKWLHAKVHIGLAGKAADGNVKVNKVGNNCFLKENSSNLLYCLFHFAELPYQLSKSTTNKIFGLSWLWAQSYTYFIEILYLWRYEVYLKKCSNCWII